MVCRKACIHDWPFPRIPKTDYRTAAESNTTLGRLDDICCSYKPFSLAILDRILSIMSSKLGKPPPITIAVRLAVHAARFSLLLARSQHMAALNDRHCRSPPLGQQYQRYICPLILRAQQHGYSDATKLAMQW